MARQGPSLHAIPDDELLRRLADLLCQSRRAEADLIAHIAEVDRRKLYARQAVPSMFVYCTEVLHLSEAEAYLRIAAARASREHPLLLEMLADGRLHLTGAGKLAPHLTPDNAPRLLARATHKTKRQIEELIAEIAPRPDARTVVRKLPDRQLPEGAPTPSGLDSRSLGMEGAPTAPPAARRVGVGSELELRLDAVAPPHPVSPPIVEPLAPARYRIQFTASVALKGKLERLQTLMRSQTAEGDLAAVIEAAVTEQLGRLDAKRFARTDAPRKTIEQTETAPTTRGVPAAVRRVVHERDGNQCRFVDAVGRRCSEQNRLEFHHRFPFGRGGDHSPPNVALLCRVHNALMAEQDYGRGALARMRNRSRNQGRERRPRPT